MESINKKIYFVFIIIFFLVANVSGLLDESTVQEGSFSQGLTIEYPKFDVHQKDTGLTLSFHVYNTTNGAFKSNADTTCTFSLYRGITGTNFYSNTTPTFSSPNVFTFDANAGNFSTNDKYGFVTQCNSSTLQFGFVSGSFDVTPNGEKPTTPKAIFYVGLLFILFSFLIIIFWAHMGDTSEIMRFWWFAFMWIPIIGISFISWKMAVDFLTSNGMIATIFYWTWFILLIIYPFFLLGLVLYTFYWIYSQREVQDLINRGFTMDEAKDHVARRKGGK